jgi:DNA methylase
MAAMGDFDFLRIPRSDQARLIAAARDTEPVRGLTHGFYKYPARFSPTFAKVAIETFTAPGQLVLDPHVGGGTTLVEALAIAAASRGKCRTSAAKPLPGFSLPSAVYQVRRSKMLRPWN